MRGGVSRGYTIIRLNMHRKISDSDELNIDDRCSGQLGLGYKYNGVRFR